jgi:biopolymer transport protein ExbB
MIRLLLSGVMLVLVTHAHAWWNEDWTARKRLVLDTSQAGAATREGLADVPVLVRLHTGNFDFLSARPDGADLRVIGADDKTSLKFHVEKFDAPAEQALIWVHVPALLPQNNSQHVWLYYGNDSPAAAAQAKGGYDVNQTGVWHFAEAAGAPQDSTAYANHAGEFAGSRIAGAAIGAGIGFAGQPLAIPATPSLKLAAGGGFTISAWLRAGDPSQDAVIYRQQDGDRAIVVALEGGKVVATVRDGKSSARAEAAAPLPAERWNHVAVTIGQKATVYLNGEAAGEAAVALPELSGAITVGEGFTGELDELNLANVARSADWIRLAALGQGGDGRLVRLGEEESAEGGGSTSYFGVILRNVTVDGWVVIVILMVMLAASALVMVNKAIVVSNTDKANRAFLESFRKLGRDEAARLDAEDDPEDADLRDSALLGAMFGRHDHFQNSSLYRIYHTGVQELKHRFGDAGRGELTPQALGAVKATLDGALVREGQRLNSLMVLLTIAISGGPFLGLLGTVVGVMITFAAIAATGDVNIAAIAPGIAAALVATVAGLAVAIPALFGYNYLGARLKAISADMHVFVDEFVAKLAEQYSR